MFDMLGGMEGMEGMEGSEFALEVGEDMYVEGDMYVNEAMYVDGDLYVEGDIFIEQGTGGADGSMAGATLATTYAAAYSDQQTEGY